MSTSHLPSIELIQATPPPTVPVRGRRWKIFFSVLILAAVVGTVVVYARAPVYRASATVLTVKPKAVDSQSEAADIEHVAIQERLLLGDELLGRLVRRLNAAAVATDLDRLRSALTVAPVPDTNMLELHADGKDPEQLQRIVNAWAESYEGLRAEEIAAATGRTSAELEDRLAALQTKIARAREELLAFRETHDIVSLERGENRSLAALQGMNTSLSGARERLIEARAHKVAVAEAVARGETVIPSEQKAEIAKLQLQVQSTRARLLELEGKYTRRFIERDPELKSLPDDLRAMERELAHALELAKTTVLDEAQQAVEAAEAAVAAQEQQLTAHQAQVQQFTDRFQEFKELEEHLARLEQLHADGTQRLAQIEVSNLEKYPPIQVVDWARLPTQPIGPEYTRELMFTLGSALLLALFVTWLVEYLGERPRPGQPAPYFGVRIAGGDPSLLERVVPVGERLTGTPATPARLDTPSAAAPILPRELAGAEVTALFSALEATTAGYAALLLCGVSPYELPVLHAACFDPTKRAISVPGAGGRSFIVAPSVWRRLDQLLIDLSEARTLPVEELDRRLYQAAQQAQLTDAAAVTALALWYTYVIYLVRQGIDVAALTARVGIVPAPVLDALAQYSPDSDKRAVEGIDFTYPALVV